MPDFSEGIITWSSECLSLYNSRTCLTCLICGLTRAERQSTPSESRDWPLRSPIMMIIIMMIMIVLYCISVGLWHTGAEDLLQWGLDLRQWVTHVFFLYPPLLIPRAAWPGRCWSPASTRRWSTWSGVWRLSLRLRDSALARQTTVCPGLHQGEDNVMIMTDFYVMTRYFWLCQEPRVSQCVSVWPAKVCLKHRIFIFLS